MNCISRGGSIGITDTEDLLLIESFNAEADLMAIRLL
jgi:hypothetical protein